MKTKEDVFNILSLINEFGIDYNVIPFNYYLSKSGKKISSLFPTNETFNHINFYENKVNIFTYDSDDKYKIARNVYSSNSWNKHIKSVTNEMYDFVYDILLMIYNDYVEITNKIENSKDTDELYKIVLNDIVIPFMKRQYIEYKNNINRDNRRIAMINYNGTAEISFGGRTCDCGRKYQAMILRDERNSYVGGFEIGEKTIRYFAPLCGESYTAFNTKNMIAQVEHAVRWICN